eukprot:scaffold232684_cov20-Tisochrysis_lutea.AAC.1
MEDAMLFAALHRVAIHRTWSGRRSLSNSTIVGGGEGSKCKVTRKIKRCPGFYPGAPLLCHDHNDKLIG